METELAFCACGCGERVDKPDNAFLFNHHTRLQKGGVCACGCGEAVQPPRRWVRGHSSRKYCACGCRQLSPLHHRYIEGHHKQKERPLCGCGCGVQVTWPHHRFVKGHATRLRYADRPDPSTFPLCACGCGGRVTKPGNTWLRGHRGRQVGYFAPTAHEQKVQHGLYQIGRAFLFQIPVENVHRPDFSFPDVKIIIQIDGHSHNDFHARQLDQDRDALLAASGWITLHWRNAEADDDLPRLLAEFEALYQSRYSIVKVR